MSMRVLGVSAGGSAPWIRITIINLPVILGIEGVLFPFLHSFLLLAAFLSASWVLLPLSSQVLVLWRMWLPWRWLLQIFLLRLKQWDRWFWSNLAHLWILPLFLAKLYLSHLRDHEGKTTSKEWNYSVCPQQTPQSCLRSSFFLKERHSAEMFTFVIAMNPHIIYLGWILFFPSGSWDLESLNEVKAS